MCTDFTYKGEGTRFSEINSLLDELLDKHCNYNNFHKEVPTTRKLKKYIINESDTLSDFIRTTIFMFLILSTLI